MVGGGGSPSMAVSDWVLPMQDGAFAAGGPLNKLV